MGEITYPRFLEAPSRFADVSIGSVFMENSVEIPQKIRTGTALYPAIPPLGISPKEMKSVSQRDTCTSLFISAILTIVRI